MQDSGLFNPLMPEDGGELRKNQKGIIEASLEEEGMLDEADEKAKTQIEAFLTALNPDFNVTVTIAS